MVNTDFLISPAYQVPQIATTRSVKLTRTAQSDAVPSSFGSAWKPGRFRMVKSGLKPSSSSRRGRRNMLRANRLCQAVSVITRTPMRCAGSAPAQQSRANSSRRWA